MPYSLRMVPVGQERSFCRTNATWTTAYVSVGETESLALCEPHSLAD